jgi:di/tricarboxylate transporter
MSAATVVPFAALGIFLGIFAVTALRQVPVGIVMLVAACGVGVLLADEPLAVVLDGFPVGTMVILAGVTYFFGIARANGTIDQAIDAVLARIGSNAVLLPFAFFALTAGVSAMGAPVGVFVMAPIGMQIARRHGIDLMLMGVAIAAGGSTGAFAPTGLYGIITHGTTRDAGVDLGPLTLFAVAIVANAAVLATAFFAFGGRELLARRHRSRGASAAAVAGERAARPPFARNQTATLWFMGALIAALIANSALGIDADVGVLCFAFGAALAFIDPAAGKAAVMKIDWPTVVMICGIITYVAVLQRVGAVDLLNEAAANVEPPLLTALATCFVAALISAFASTTGTLAALVPLAVPLALSGDVPGWAFMSALAVSASLVDMCPFSPNGAVLVATSDEDQRPRMSSLLARWGLSLLVLGPLGLVAALFFLPV